VVVLAAMVLLEINNCRYAFVLLVLLLVLLVKQLVLPITSIAHSRTARAATGCLRHLQRQLVSGTCEVAVTPLLLVYDMFLCVELPFIQACTICSLYSLLALTNAQH
jgi:hypothetical protein